MKIKILKDRVEIRTKGHVTITLLKLSNRKIARHVVGVNNKTPNVKFKISSAIARKVEALLK